MRTYCKLAELYSQNWGEFSLNYLKIIDFIEKEYKFDLKDVLDISCGTGELVRALYKKGINVIGADISEDMILMAKKSSDSDIEFFVEDMANINIDRKFDLIISAFDSINYILDKKHLQKAFSNINKHLRENSYFIFDITTLTMYKEKFHGVIEQKFNGVTVSKIMSFDSSKKLSSLIFDFGKDGCEEHIQRAYTKKEIIQMLKISNFEVCKIVQDFDFSNVNDKSNKMIFIAKNS